MKSMVKVCIAMTLLALMAGCRSTSPQGGIEFRNEAFSISVPTHHTLKQGEVITVLVELNRGAFFKRDVELNIKATGLTVSPSNVLVKASEKPEASLQVSAERTAALGDYLVLVKGTPPDGKTTSTSFTVTVVAP